MGEQEINKKKNEGEKKGNNGETIVVFKVDMHCEGCAKKIRRSVKYIDGVKSVKTDCKSNKLTVVGKVDSTKVKEIVEEKIRKKVEIISPQPNKPSNNDGGEKKGDEKKSEGKGDEKKSEGKGDGKKSGEKKEKPKEPQVTTVVLKTRMHCEGCAHKIKRVVGKYEGVQDVRIDLQKDTITIKGTMNVKELMSYLNSKLKRAIELVQPKKDEGDEGDKKKKEGKKKAQEGEGDGEKKKKDGSEKNGGGGGAGENTTKIEVNKMEHNGYPSYGSPGYGFGYNYVYDPRLNVEASYGHQVASYWHGPSHPPQMFSDENPNACSVM